MAPKKKKKESVTKTKPVNIEFNVGEFETIRDFMVYASSPKKIFFTNFLSGTAKGLGFIVGATIVLGLLAYILGNFLVNLPIVGDFFQVADTWLSQTLESYTSTQ